MGKTIDLTGQKFGYWTVMYKSDKRASDRSVMWHCVCKCGNEKDVVGTCLRNGSSKSCGCYQKEQTSKANIKTLDELIHDKYYEIRFISDSCDNNVFDALVLSFPLIQGNNTRQDMLNIVQENIQSVKKRVVRILNKDKDYKKYGVPVNFLKITKILITRDNMLEISLELKKV